MKILQVSACFYPAWAYGGIVPVAYYLSKELAKRGHEVVVYTTDAFDANRRQQTNYLEVEGIKVLYFRNISNSLAWKRYFLAPSMTFQFQTESKNFNLIHVHGFRNFTAILVHHYAKKYSIPYIIQAHGSLDTYFQKKTLKRIFDKTWGHKVLQDARKHIVLTPTEGEQCKSMGINDDKVEIVPNGIDLTEFESLPERGRFRRQYGLSNQKIILYLGRICRPKGLDLLAEGFADLSKDSSDAKLVIVGPDDGYRTVLEALVKELGIEERTLFTGPLYGREKLEAYVDADIFVTPSFYGFPVTFLEACACGVPIVTTQAGDRLDWLHNQVGLVVPFDKGQLAGALERMLTDEDARQKFSRRGKALVQEQFNWQKIAGKLEEIYCKAIEVK